MVERLKTPQAVAVSVAVVGKYVELHDAYLCVREALYPRRRPPRLAVDIDWINSEELERAGRPGRLDGVDGIVVPGGFGERGIEGKIAAARYAREHEVPYLGLCLGMQVMVHRVRPPRLAQRRAQLAPSSTPTRPIPVIDLMPEQRGHRGHGRHHAPGRLSLPAGAGHQGRRRLRPGRGRTSATATASSSTTPIASLWPRRGWSSAASRPTARWWRSASWRDHPWMVGTQFHPEFRSRPNRPHPLFRDFIGRPPGEQALLRGARRKPPPHS